MSERAQFSVWVFWPDGTHQPLGRCTSAAEAIADAERVTGAYRRLRGVAAIVQPEKVIITDGGDETVFEWRPEEAGQGIA